MRSSDIESLLKRVASLEKRVERLEREELIRYSTWVYNNANISIPNNSATTLTFNSERYDYGDLHSTVANTSQLVAPTNGIYYIHGQATFDTDANGYRLLWIDIDDSNVVARTSINAINGTYSYMEVSTVIYLAAASYAELKVLQTSGGALDVLYSSGGNYWYSPAFQMHWLDV